MKRLVAFAVALVLFALTCIGVWQWEKTSLFEKKTVLAYHNSDTRNSSKTVLEELFKGNAIPVLGSSELSASDDVAYPPALFHNGNSDFNMILIGRGSMQSLHHAINLGAMADILPDKKVVLILSPQWFTASNLSSEAYASRFSERMYSEFLKNTDISYNTKEKVTERVKSLLTADPKQLERVEKYEKAYLRHGLNPLLQCDIRLYDSFMSFRQDFLLAKEAEHLEDSGSEFVETETIDFEQLLVQAQEAGDEACTNNQFYIYDEYYDTYVRDVEETKKNSWVNMSYLESPEYDDLRIFLDVCKETGTEPLIVSIPVNGLWYDWCGFPTENRQAYYEKIRNICAEYQVEIADFSDKEYESYFLKDVMHLGWKGWVYVDEAVYEFYKQT